MNARTRRFWIVMLLILAGCLALHTGAASRDPSAATAGLHRAVAINHTTDALRRLAAGADVGALDQTGHPPLYWAVLFGNDILAVALLERGADSRWTGPDGATLLHEAARWPVLEPSGKRPSRGDPPSLSGKLKIIERLLGAGLDPKAADRTGSTPLHIATGLPLAGPEPRAIIQRLVAAGARPDAANVHGLTPLDLARRRGAAELVAALEEVR